MDYISREAALRAVTGAELPDKTADGLPIANGKRSVSDCVRRIKAIPAAGRGRLQRNMWWSANPSLTSSRPRSASRAGQTTKTRTIARATSVWRVS